MTFFYSHTSVRQKKEGSQQQDDDDDDDNLNGTIDVDELDIDEEAALNTDANIRVTRPSFSMACRENNSLLGVGDSDSEPVPVGNRVSAIRFKGFFLSFNFSKFTNANNFKFKQKCRS